MPFGEGPFVVVNVNGNLLASWCVYICIVRYEIEIGTYEKCAKM